MQSNYVRNFGYVSLLSLLGAAARPRSRAPQQVPQQVPQPAGGVARTNNPAGT